MAEAINHPSHYDTGRYECIEVMEEALGREAVKAFCTCNAFKYLYRHKRKNGLEDLKKARWYLNKAIEMTEEEEEEDDGKGEFEDIAGAASHEEFYRAMKNAKIKMTRADEREEEGE